MTAGASMAAGLLPEGPGLAAELGVELIDQIAATCKSLQTLLPNSSTILSADENVSRPRGEHREEIRCVR